MNTEALSGLVSSLTEGVPLWLGWLAAPSLGAVGVWLVVAAIRGRRTRAVPAGAEARPRRPARPSRQRRRSRTRRPLATAGERAFDALAHRFGLDRRSKRLVVRLADAAQVEPVGLLLSPSGLRRASALLDDPPADSGLSPLTIDERRRLLTLTAEPLAGLERTP